jgi:DNA-binding transcriptional LysR family regulator
MPHDLDTALLRTFTVLADTASFSRTAELIGRTQSAVSAQIRKLEDQLGRELFFRTTRAVRLTAEGEALRGPALEVLRLCGELPGKIAAAEPQGEVRFGAPEDFASVHLPEVLARFAASHRGVRLHVECDLTMTLIERYEAGLLDVVIVKQRPGSHHPAARLLWQERLVWVAADRALMRESPLPLVLSPAPCVYRGRALAALDAQAIGWHAAFVSPSFGGMAAAVRAGLGLAVMPEAHVPDGLCVLDGLPMLEPADLAMIISPAARAPALAFGGFLEGTLKGG